MVGAFIMQKPEVEIKIFTIFRKARDKFESIKKE